MLGSKWTEILHQCRPKLPQIWDLHSALSRLPAVLVRSFPAKGINNDHADNTWEVLPSVARTMNFRLTVRDNFSDGGNTTNDDMVVTFVEDSGPFKITQPNDTSSLSASTPHTIAWNIAGTDQQPVNCGNVDIFLSLDGGLSYPILLVENTANDGF